MLHQYQGFQNEITEACKDLKVLENLNKNWSSKALVRKFEPGILPEFDRKKDDFLEELLPFKDHELYLMLPDNVKKKILSCGWIIYNKKTIAIETKIVNPVCSNIMRGVVPGLNEKVCREVAMETMADEFHHVVLVTAGNDVCQKERGFSLEVPEFTLVKKMNEHIKHYDCQWKKEMVSLCTAIVSEVFISDYLKLLSTDDRIQPLNRAITNMHRTDELRHGAIFDQFTRVLYKNLDKEQKDFLAEILPKPVTWFADLELDVWNSALQQIGVQGSSLMIQDCRKLNESCVNRIDYSSLTMLANDIGISNMPLGLTSFRDEGIMDVKEPIKFGLSKL